MFVLREEGRVKPLEVFVRSCPRSMVRRELAEAVFERWHLFEGIKLTAISPSGDSFPYATEENFHWQARVQAEKSSTADYVFADDDILPPDSRFIEWLREDWAKQSKEVVMMGVVVAPESILLRQNGFIPAFQVGGVYMVRKGSIPWHQFSGPVDTQDEVIGKWVESHGLKQVVSGRLVVNHLGYGLSESTPGCWLRV